jgi:pimeloyl-ACP methyl ester carboxylesterase
VRGYLTGLAILLASGVTVRSALGIDSVKIEKHSFPLGRDMTRADIFVARTTAVPRAVLVLCPGFNGSGEDLVREAEWQKFAINHQLGLLGISFASDPAITSKARGYYFAASGSGQIVVNAVRKLYQRDLPLLMFGFSSGASFTCKFADWKPDRVLAWCADAGSGGEQLRQSRSPPGIIACGEFDAAPYGIALSYFKQGRALGKPWLWVSLEKLKHDRAPVLEVFVRNYFGAVLSRQHPGCWVDIDLKKKIEATEARKVPSVSGWLPDRWLFKEWERIHEP